MAKGEELWDDSALVDAFNDAMSKYKVKKYHGKNGQGSLADGEEVQVDSEDTASALEQGHGVTREVQETSKDTSQPTAELLDGENIGPLDENHFAQSLGHEQPSDLTTGLASTTQDAEAYNQLMSQYYELEEKRQTVLQQLQQLSDHYYQQPAEGSTSQDQSVPANQPPSLTTCTCYSCPHASTCPAVPCSSLSATLTCCGNSGSPGENAIVKTAMEAAAKAISFTKEKSVNNNSIKDGDGQGLAQEPGSEADLCAVLNAWYSAGFYTAKYLTEQSMAKK
ncbi:hypothetical protein LINGRAHAP2_LOCUS26158 [Linum grandiflorum]